MHSFEVCNLYFSIDKRLEEKIICQRVNLYHSNPSYLPGWSIISAAFVTFGNSHSPKVSFSHQDLAFVFTKYWFQNTTLKILPSYSHIISEECIGFPKCWNIRYIFLLYFAGGSIGFEFLDESSSAHYLSDRISLEASAKYWQSLQPFTFHS